MITVWKTPIAASVEQILKDLRLLLYSEGLLKDQNNTGSDVMITCPFHKGGHERKPSCGVSLREKVTADRTYEAGTVHCYTCGYTGDLPTFISDLLGLSNAMEGFRWLVGHYNYSATEREEIQFNFYRGSDESAAVINPADVEMYHKNLLESDRAKEYLRGREISEDVMEIFNLGFDPEDGVVLFPVYSRDGKVLFFKSRSITGKRFFNAKDIDKTASVYGLYQALSGGVNADTEIWLVESEIDALSLITRGYMAFALMGSDLSDQQVKELLRAPYRRFIAATDNDSAGRKAVRKIKDKLIPYGFRIFNLRWETDLKDVNELIQHYGDNFTDYLTRF